jgi:glyoxylase-like metal-dependent hydrolase (beta-lactamase superfamily II)
MKKHAYITVGLGVALALGMLSYHASAQQSKSVSEKSFTEARRVLDAGIEALGGREALQKVEDFSVKWKGTNYARNQSLSPDIPYFKADVEGSGLYDSKRNWIVFEQAATLPGFKFHNRQIVKVDKGFTLDLVAKSVTPVTNPNFIGNVTRSRFPHILLLAALERATTLRLLGQTDYDGKQHNVIVFATSDGTQSALYFNAQTNLLSKVENLDTDALVGDVTQEFIFPEYRSAGDMKVATGRIVKRGGEVVQELKYSDMQFNTHPNESAFEKPTGFEELPATNPTPTVTALAKDVYLLEDVSNGYNVMFVAFKDHILVVEAPLNSATSQKAIAKIKETVPNKPIKYLVLTHYHDDHAGGTRGYMAEGATLVTTAGNKGYFEKMAAATRTIDPDALSKNQRKPVIETIQDRKRVFSDDEHTVEVYDIGPGPHAKEMLIVYLPKEKILFQGDLLNLPSATKVVTPGNETTAHFADRVRELGLDVEKIAAVHGRTATMAEFRAAVEKMNARK